MVFRPRFHECWLEETYTGIVVVGFHPRRGRPRRPDQLNFARRHTHCGLYQWYLNIGIIIRDVYKSVVYINLQVSEARQPRTVEVGRDLKFFLYNSLYRVFHTSSTFNDVLYYIIGQRVASGYHRLLRCKLLKDLGAVVYYNLKLSTTYSHCPSSFVNQKKQTLFNIISKFYAKINRYYFIYKMYIPNIECF